MLAKKGIPNAFEEHAIFEDRLWNKLLMTAPQSLGLTKPTPKEIKAGLNRLRIELKQNDSGRNEKVEAVYEDEAEEMIFVRLRTPANYSALFQKTRFFRSGSSL